MTQQDRMMEEANYRNDPRVRGGDSHFWDYFYPERMIATFTTWNDEDEEVELEVRMRFEVCSGCNGKGSHVNPSIDAGGISSEAFYDDPDFEEDYFSGRYDVSCYTCKGKRVEPVLDLDNNPEETIKAIDDYLQGMADDWAEREAERRMGC